MSRISGGGIQKHIDQLQTSGVGKAAANMLSAAKKFAGRRVKTVIDAKDKIMDMKSKLEYKFILAPEAKKFGKKLDEMLTQEIAQEGFKPENIRYNQPYNQPSNAKPQDNPLYREPH